MNKRIASILVLLICYNLKGQSIRPEIDQIVNGMAKENVLHAAAVGYAGVRTEQYERFIALKEKATREELITLTDHTNETVRCYSFRALAARKDSSVFSILIKHLSDTGRVETFSGCIGSFWYVGDYLYLMLTHSDWELDNYRLTENERQLIDSILAFDSNNVLLVKEGAFMRLKPNLNYYNKVRKMIVEENKREALILLAKFQNQRDAKLILEWLNSEDVDNQIEALKAVIYFPDSSFFPILSKIHSEEVNKSDELNHQLLRELFQALVQYKTNESLKLMELSLKAPDKKIRAFHASYISQALEKYPDRIFDALKLEIDSKG